MKIIFKKGNVYFEECQYEDAVAEYERAEELTSNGEELAEIYVKIGRCYWDFYEYTETGSDDAGI